VCAVETCYDKNFKVVFYTKKRDWLAHAYLIAKFISIVVKVIVYVAFRTPHKSAT